MRPADTALADQTEAAVTHAEQAVRLRAELLGGDPPRWVTQFGPVTRRLMADLGKRLIASTTRPCFHLSLRAPVPALWLPHAPGKVRCADCAYKVMLRTQGTREDNCCDGCRRWSPDGMFIGQVLLPAAVFEVGPVSVAWPPVILSYGLCAGCRAEDIAGTVEA